MSSPKQTPIGPRSTAGAIAAYYRDGASISMLMGATGHSYERIRAMLRRSGIQLRPPSHTVALRRTPPGKPR